MRALWLALAVLAAPLAAHALEADQPAPDFTGTPLRGGEALRLADLRGKVVYLDFWASWCGPCRRSLPWMEQLRRELGASGLEVVAVNVDENPADALAFLKRFAVGYPIVGDSRGAIASLYDVREMPSSYLIDRRGTVRVVHRGFNSAAAAQLREQARALLGEQP